MTKRAADSGRPKDPAELIEQVKAMAGEMKVDELRAVMGQYVTSARTDADPFSRPTPPNRRRPRQEQANTYRIRLDIADAKPPIWRRLDVGSHLGLDDLHVVIQTAFGWTDSHLHRFGVGTGIWDRDTELYLCSFDVDDEDEKGIPEEQVRLDEVLVEPGDTLLYIYDYGDDWDHRIRLEKITDRLTDAPPATCVDGRHAGPPEDCGGIYGYQEMLSAAADPTNEEHADAVERMEHYLGGTDYDPSRFDCDEVNAALASALDSELRAAYHSLLVELLLRVQGRPSADRFGEVAAAQLDQPTEVDSEMAEHMTARLRWMLHRIGDDGIKLTAAGYLPPTHVSAAMAELNLSTEWIGKGNREDMTLPVLELREATQQLGLARKYRGRLLLTKQGKRLRENPLKLWDHIARGLPPYKPGSSEYDGSLVALALVAAGHDRWGEASRALIAAVLTDLGWRRGTGEPISACDAFHIVQNTVSVLEDDAAFEKVDFGQPSAPTRGGRSLARAALGGSR